MNILIKKLSKNIKNIDYRLNSYQFINGNTVKMIALIAMLIDHFSKIVLEWLIIWVWVPMRDNEQMASDIFDRIYNFIHFELYNIGVISFPLFCFLLVEGFKHTNDIKKYFKLLIIFAIISELPFDLAFFSAYSKFENTYPFYLLYQNIFFTLLLGLTAIYSINKFSNYYKNKILNFTIQFSCVLLPGLIAELIHSDYGCWGVIYIVGFYICRNSRVCQVLIFIILYIILTNEEPGLYILTFCIVILLYNGKRGSLNLKYFFYIFYPAHISILYLITVYLAKFVVK